MLGLAIGDAYGGPYEYIERKNINKASLSREKFSSGGKWELQEGMFTEDTSLALVLAESLLNFHDTIKLDEYNFIMIRLKKLYQSEGLQDLHRLDKNYTCLKGRDIREKAFQWYEQGHFSSKEFSFSIGETTLKYLKKNKERNTPFCISSDFMDKTSGGNGALMRLAPVPLYFYGLYLRKKQETGIDNPFIIHRAIEESGFSTYVTHPSVIAGDCNRYLAALIIGCLQNATKYELLKDLFVPKGLPEDYWTRFPLCQELKNMIYKLRDNQIDITNIKNEGFCLKSLESCLWAFKYFDNFMDGLIHIVCLGDDTDTVGAIYGQLAGCYYSIEGIPKNLVNKCFYSNFLRLISQELLRAPKDRFENSYFYEGTMVLLGALEKNAPKPNQYKNIDEFNELINKMISKFKYLQEFFFNQLDKSCQDEASKNELILTTNSLLADFQKRFYERTLEL